MMRRAWMWLFGWQNGGRDGCALTLVFLLPIFVSAVLALLAWWIA